MPTVTMPEVTNDALVVNKLQSLVLEGDEVDRCYAIRSLASINSKRSAELLINCLHDEDIDVCIDAVTALGKLGDEQTASKLIESLLNDPDGEVKTACVIALSELDSKEAIPYFLQMAEQRPEGIQFETEEWDAWWDMQLESIKALGKMRIAKAVPVLKRILEEDDCLDIEDEIYGALASIGGEADTLLISLLENGPTRTRRRVARALGKSASKPTLKALARAVQDTAPEVREAVLKSLPQRNALPYLQIVLLLFKDSNPAVRSQAIKTAQTLSKSTGSNGDIPRKAPFVDKLIPLITDPDPKVQTTVLDTLSNLGWRADKKHASNIIALLSKSESDCFAAVCRFIHSQPLSQAISDLILLLKKNQLGAEENAHALITLGKLHTWNDDVKLILGAYIFDETKAVRLAALEALAELDKAFPAKQEQAARDAQIPFDLICEALQGGLLPPASKRDIPVTIAQASDTPSADKPATAHPENAETAHDVADESDPFIEGALQEIAQSIKKGEQPHPLSTLDSIAITSVEQHIEAQSNLEKSEQAKSALSAEEKQALQDFTSLIETNKETAKWLFNKESVDVSTDIRRLAARIMASTKSDTAIDQLLATFKRDDIALRTEATASIGQLIADNPGLYHKHAKIAQIIIPQLNNNNRDLRIAVARVLGEIGPQAAIEPLIQGFDDEDVAMRIQCLHSVAKLAQQSTEEQIDAKLLAQQMLDQLQCNESGVLRAVIEGLVALFSNKLNGDAIGLKQNAIRHLIDAGMSGRHGRVKEVSRGLLALDKSLASKQLLAKLDSLKNSVERRYIVEMIGEIHSTDKLR